MFTRSGLSGFRVAMVLVLSITLTWIPTGGASQVAVSTPDPGACRIQTGIFYEECMNKTHVAVGVPASENNATDIGDVIHAHLNPESTCKAKLNLINCFVKKLCSSPDCTFQQSEIGEALMVEEHNVLKKPCKWVGQELEGKRCTKDIWNKEHGISTAAPPKNSTVSLVSEISTLNSTGISGSGNSSTTPSNSTGGMNSSATATSSSIFVGMQQKEIIFFAAVCLIVLLITCIYCFFYNP